MWAAVLPLAIIVGCGSSGKSDAEQRSDATSTVLRFLPDCDSDQSTERLVKCYSAAQKLGQIILDTCDEGPDRLAFFIAIVHDEQGVVEGRRTAAEAASICPEVYAKSQR